MSLVYSNDEHTRVWCNRCDGDGVLHLDTCIRCWGERTINGANQVPPFEGLRPCDCVPEGVEIEDIDAEAQTVRCPDCHGEGSIDCADYA